MNNVINVITTVNVSPRKVSMSFEKAKVSINSMGMRHVLLI